MAGPVFLTVSDARMIESKILACLARPFLYVDPDASAICGIVNLDKRITGFDSDADRLSWTSAGRITARSINNAAVICGEGSFPEGTRAFVLVPVPGP